MIAVLFQVSQIMTGPGLFSIDRPSPRAYDHFYGC